MSAFATYLIGFLILVGGLALGAYLLNAPPVWIGVGALILIGLGVMLATRQTKLPGARGGAAPPPPQPPPAPPAAPRTERPEPPSPPNR